MRKVQEVFEKVSEEILEEKTAANRGSRRKLVHEGETKIAGSKNQLDFCTDTEVRTRLKRQIWALRMRRMSEEDWAEDARSPAASRREAIAERPPYSIISWAFSSVEVAGWCLTRLAM